MCLINRKHGYVKKRHFTVGTQPSSCLIFFPPFQDSSFLHDIYHCRICTAGCPLKDQYFTRKGNRMKLEGFLSFLSVLYVFSILFFSHGDNFFSKRTAPQIVSHHKNSGWKSLVWFLPESKVTISSGFPCVFVIINEWVKDIWGKGAQ